MADLDRVVLPLPVVVANTLAAALRYAQEGLAVFPLHTPRADGTCSCGQDHSANPKQVGKHPRTSNGCKAATTDKALINGWWTAWPDANIGIACGGVSGIVVLDVDGPEGEESLARLVEKHGPLPATRTVRTGKGRQMYFRHPGGKVRNAAPINRDYPGLDSRADGGYVVAPPSLHYSGRHYAVEASSREQVADAPGWLVKFVNRRAKDTPRSGVTSSNDESFAEGSRNAKLASIAGSLRMRGLSEAALATALLAINEQQCNPPLPDDEVKGIARSIAKYPSGAAGDALLQSLNDKGNAERFVAQHSNDIRYVPERGRWLVWDGIHWVEDASGQVVELAKLTAETTFGELTNLPSDDLRKAVFKHAQATHQRPRLEAMIKLATSDAAVVVRECDLDRDDWVLGVRNGVIDLRTGALRPHRREDLITRLAPVEYDPKAQCPTWQAFLNRVAGGDPDLIRYLQRVVGYCLTGRTHEQVLFFLYGSGANGKSTFLNLLKELHGPDLAKQTPYETLTFKKFGRNSTNDLARLQGVRVTLTTEIEDGTQLDESLVKQLTGGEPITARYLYREYTEYIPKFKLLIAGNHKPVIRGDDLGIWRRIHLIPFIVTIPEEERDPHLSDKLLKELPGILNWALAGCREWQASGLRPPRTVLEWVEEYRRDSDLIGLWVTECCTVGADLTAQASDAYSSYRGWAFKNGLRPMANASFGKKLAERFTRRETNTGRIYEGVSVVEYPLPYLR